MLGGKHMIVMIKHLLAGGRRVIVLYYGSEIKWAQT